LSIAINPKPAASSLDDPAAPSAVTSDGNSFLPFASILDEQSSANQEADDVGEADAALDVVDAAVPASQTAVDSLAGLLTASIPGAGPLLRKDEIDRSPTMQGLIKRDTRSVDPTALLLQAVQSAVAQLDMSPAPSTPAPSVPAFSTSGVKDADDVGEVDAPLDDFDVAIPASQPRIDSLAALLAASLPGTQSSPRKGEIDQSTTTQLSIKKDKPAVDPTTLLLTAAQDAVRQLATLPAPLAPAPSTSDVTNRVTTEQPLRRPNDDELVPHLFTALTDSDARAVLDANSDDAPLPAAPPPLTDLLIKASVQNPEAEPLRAPDLPLQRTPPPTAPAAGSMVDAIRLAINQGPQFDQDRGFTQSSTAGFDRRVTKTAVVPAIHPTEAGSFDAVVRQSAPSSVPTVTLPNEDGVMSSIVQSMRLQMRDGVGSAVVHLEPDYLGAVSVSLRVENGVVTASLHAENPQVRAWMEANAPLLRDSLAGQGLSLDRLLVTDEHIVDDQSQSRRQRQEQEQQAQQRPRRNNAATFEVVV
jgi:hypothetical protein